MTDSLPLLTLFQRALTLKLLPRTGWLQRGVAQPESVAEHVFGVAMLALLVGDSVPDLDRGRLLAIALVHDLAETLIGDLPASARRMFGADAKHAAEQRALDELVAALPDKRDYRALWQEYASASTPEARLIKGLDRIEMLAQALLYERAGNRALDEFWAGAHEGWPDEFPILRDMAMHLVAQRSMIDHRPLTTDHRST